MRWPFSSKSKGRTPFATGSTWNPGTPTADARRSIRASFDAAQTSIHNSRHWVNADDLSADAAASADVRRILRNRARYEVANSSLARGIVLTLANDVVGTGPRLQLITDDDDLNGRLESAFTSWTRQIRLDQKLRTMRIAKAQDGEIFGLMFTNRALAGPVKLDVQLIEADRIAGSLLRMGAAQTQRYADGIILDDADEPVTYQLRTSHPGAPPTGALDGYENIPAEWMIHWFRRDRPGQHRGLPDIMPALPLFAQLRRWTLATLGAAETAANISLVMNTTAPPGGEAAEVEPWVTMELERNAIMFAPEGWESSQIKAEHPAGTFDVFRKGLINEIGRCLNMPLNIAACDSSGYNYASGRLDHQTYFRSIQVERSECEATVLDRLFSAWLQEASVVTRYHLLEHTDRRDWPHRWFWPGREHVDPLKEARAAESLFKCGLLTEADYQGRAGKDWQAEMKQRAREREARVALQLPDPTQKQEAPK